MNREPLIALPIIVAELRRRPEWERERPLKVPPDLYEAAHKEMTAVMKNRGFRLGTSKAVRAENFLLQGTAIVLSGENIHEKNC